MSFSSFPSLVSPRVSFSLSYCSFFIDSDGRVWSCGLNNHGQLGLGDTTKRNSPTLIPISNVIAVSSGYDHSIFLTQDGKLWSVGSNSNGQTGVTKKSQQPEEIAELNNISQVSCGEKHSVCVNDQGFVWSFGKNDCGQLGLGNTTNTNVPTQISSLRNIVLVTCGGYHTLCLDSENSLWSFGKNNYGQLGIGNQVSQHQPVRVSGFNQKIIQISCGYDHSVLLDDQGSVWSFGSNQGGKLGLADLEKRTEPTKVLTIKDIQQLSCGVHHTMCVDIQHNVWSFGYNNNGQLGQGDFDNRNKPTIIPKLQNIVHVFCGRYHTVCLDGQGDFWSFGYNDDGELGLGDTNNRNSPEKIAKIKGGIERYKQQKGEKQKVKWENLKQFLNWSEEQLNMWNLIEDLICTVSLLSTSGGDQQQPNSELERLEKKLMEDEKLWIVSEDLNLNLKGKWKQYFLQINQLYLVLQDTLNNSQQLERELVEELECLEKKIKQIHIQLEGLKQKISLIDHNIQPVEILHQIVKSLSESEENLQEKYDRLTKEKTFLEFTTDELCLFLWKFNLNRCCSSVSSNQLTGESFLFIDGQMLKMLEVKRVYEMGRIPYLIKTIKKIGVKELENHFTDCPVCECDSLDSTFDICSEYRLGITREQLVEHRLLAHDLLYLSPKNFIKFFKMNMPEAIQLCSQIQRTLKQTHIETLNKSSTIQ